MSKVIDLFVAVTACPSLWTTPTTPLNSLWTLNLPFTSSMFKTNIFSVRGKPLVLPIPERLTISFALIFRGEKLPVTLMLVTIPVIPVVPTPTFKANLDVLNPIRCLPSNFLSVSVDRPETVIISPSNSPWGWLENPVTFPLLLSYLNTTFSILVTVDPIDTMSLPPIDDIFPEKPLPFPTFLIPNFSFTL